MSEGSSCPDDRSLKRFLLGQSTAEEAEAVKRHLEACERCVAALQTLDANDSMVTALQARGGIAGEVTDQGVRLLTEWLKNIRLPAMTNLYRPAGPREETTPPTEPVEDPPGPDETPLHAEQARGDSAVISDLLAPNQGPNEIGRLGQYQVRKVLGRGGMGALRRWRALRTCRSSSSLP